MRGISIGGWHLPPPVEIVSTGGGQCQPPVETLLYRRLALTTACRNAFLQAVVNANRLYKIISVIFLFYF